VLNEGTNTIRNMLLLVIKSTSYLAYWMSYMLLVNVYEQVDQDVSSVLVIKATFIDRESLTYCFHVPRTELFGPRESDVNRYIHRLEYLLVTNFP